MVLGWEYAKKTLDQKLDAEYFEALHRTGTPTAPGFREGQVAMRQVSCLKSVPKSFLAELLKGIPEEILDMQKDSMTKNNTIFILFAARCRSRVSYFLLHRSHQRELHTMQFFPLIDIHDHDHHI